MAKYYAFEPMEVEDSYQLVSKGRFWDSKKEVYYQKNQFGKYVLSVCCNDETANTNMMSSVEAVKIVGLLKKLGVSKTDMQNIRFPKGTEHIHRKAPPCHQRECTYETNRYNKEIHARLFLQDDTEAERRLCYGPMKGILAASWLVPGLGRG